jgi:cytochrome P450
LRAALPPGPRYPSPIQMVGFWKRPLAFLERCRALYGKRFTLRFPFAPPFVMLSDPDDIKDAFMAPPDVLHPGEGAKVLEPVVGTNSVILLDEARHLEQRKLMLPAFHGENMERLTSTMIEVAEREIAGWPTDRPIELHPRMQRLTLDVILRAVFGLEGERLEALRDVLAAMLVFGDRPTSLMPPPPEWLARRIPVFRDFLRLQDQADRMIFEQIEERRAAANGHNDILAMLLEARHEDGSPMSEQELRDELMTLLVAGHETTASSMAWTFERLVREPEVVERLTEEIDAGDGDEYLTATIYESMRRRPVLPNAEPRLTMREVEVGGWTYPENVCLVANAYLVQHDPEIYPDPYAFRPERFLDEQPGTYTWIPFGGGRRRCIGASFAMVEMKIVIRALLSARELRPAGKAVELPGRRNITITPEGRAMMALPERPSHAAARAIAPNGGTAAQPAGVSADG